VARSRPPLQSALKSVQGAAKENRQALSPFHNVHHVH
jgi:hypothetical protein